MKESKKYSIKRSIVSLISALIILSAIILTSTSYYFGKQSVEIISKKLLDKTSTAILGRASGYLSPVDRSIKQLQMTIETGFFNNIQSTKMLNDYLKSILASNEEFFGVYYGTKDGNFFMAKKFPDNKIASRYTIRTQKNIVQIWKDAPKNIKSEILSLKDGFDPRTRPWYKQATLKKDIIWTPSYIFSSDQSLGITRSFPIVLEDGHILGVFGIDIKLGNLYDFVQKLKPSKNSEIFIVNNINKKVVVDTTLEKNHQLYDLSQTKNSDLKHFFIPNNNSLEKQEYQGKEYFVSQTSFTSIPWNLMILIPEDDFLEAINQNNLISISVSLIILIFTIFVGIVLSNKISKPLKRVAIHMNKVKDFNLSDNEKVNTSILEIDIISKSLENMRTGLKSFQKYVPSDLVSELISMGKEAKIDGEKKTLSVLFTDIEGFTSITERNKPEELVKDLAQYLGLMGGVVMQEKGVIDKYIGDAIMAFWGAPKDVEKHAFHACNTAIICKRKEKELMIKWKELGKDLFHSRIGINTGEVIVGNMGSDKRLSYTVLGDSVNLAARLESINKQYGTYILISEDTYQEVKDLFVTRFLDKVAVKGKTLGVSIYELIEEEQNIPKEELAFICAFEDAIKLYQDRKWIQAKEAFEELRVHPSCHQEGTQEEGQYQKPR